jgi:hypothetical protein
VKKINTKRSETWLERITRLHHELDGGPKPKHYDDKNIVTMEEWKTTNQVNGKAKPFKKVSKDIKPTNIDIKFYGLNGLPGISGVDDD